LLDVNLNSGGDTSEVLKLFFSFETDYESNI